MGLYETRFDAKRPLRDEAETRPKSTNCAQKTAGKACICRIDEGMRQHPSRISHSFHLCTAAVTERRRRCKYAPSVHHLTRPILTTEQMRKKMNDPKFNFVLLCNKICGGAHYKMKMIVVVKDKKSYDLWMKQKSKETFKAKYFPAPVSKAPVTPATTSNAAMAPATNVNK